MLVCLLCSRCTYELTEYIGLLFQQPEGFTAPEGLNAPETYVQISALLGVTAD